MKRFLIFLLVIFLVGKIFPVVNTNRLVIIGFLNKGDKADDDYNTIITHSLGNFLSRVDEFEIIDQQIVNKLVDERKLFESKNLDKENALDVGVSLSAGKIILGEYIVNRKTKKIQITMYIYNVITSEMELKRTYTENLGPDIFDTVDKMITTISSHLLSRPVSIARLLVKVGTEGDYELYINNKFQKVLNQGDFFNEAIIADLKTEVILKKLPEKEIVFSNIIFVKSGETFNIFYVPTANLIINSKGFEGGEILIDNVIMGKINNDGVLILSNLQVNRTISVAISKEKKLVAEKQITLIKAKDYLLDFSKDKEGILSERSSFADREKSSGLSQYYLGQSAGKLRAQRDGGWFWLGGSLLVTATASTFIHLFGFIPGALIVVWSYNAVGRFPSDDFIGKDDMYIAGYKEAYMK